jgi:acylphosphatase
LDSGIRNANPWLEVIADKGSYFTQKKATSYNLTGWVRNTPNSKVSPLTLWLAHIQILTLKQVEGEAQGEEDNIQKLLKDLDKGPTHSHVVKLEKSEIDVQEGESGFEVRA